MIPDAEANWTAACCSPVAVVQSSCPTAAAIPYDLSLGLGSLYPSGILYILNENGYWA